MRTVTHGSRLGALCSLMGSTKDALTPDEAAAYFEALNQAVEWAWERLDWPELCNVTPVVAGLNGEMAVIPWGGETAPMPLAIYTADPRAGAAEEVGFCLENGQIVVQMEGTLWMRSRPRPPVWSADMYDPARQYYTGDTVYDWETGHGYAARQDVVGQSPADASKWQRLTMPFVFSRAVTTKAHSILLGGREAQSGAAAAKSRDADITLQENMQVVAIQGRQKTYWTNNNG